jgi:hypothetical protein
VISAGLDASPAYRDPPRPCEHSAGASGRIRKDVPRHSIGGSSVLIGETRREKRETNGIVPGERSVNDTAGEKGTVSS